MIKEVVTRLLSQPFLFIKIKVVVEATKFTLSFYTYYFFANLESGCFDNYRFQLMEAILFAISEIIIW